MLCNFTMHSPHGLPFFWRLPIDFFFYDLEDAAPDNPDFNETTDEAMVVTPNKIRPRKKVKRDWTVSGMSPENRK